MAGFIRRFGYRPDNSVLTEIEGVVIVDLPPSGGISGVATGVVALVGEFVDASYATKVAANGDVSSNLVPVEIRSGQDLVAKLGGFDATIGDFGDTLGNGYCALRNKRFPRLIVCPIDNITPSGTTNKGIRVWRDLPTNKGTTNTNPVVPVTAAAVAAGREFKSGSNRVRIARTVQFTATAPLKTGTDGSVTTAGAAATQTFTAASGAFNDGTISVGDVIVVGVIGTSLGSNAQTFRVNAIGGATTLTLERMDGANFAFTTEGSLPWRIHKGSDADSGYVDGRKVAITSANGYSVIARPLDATIVAATIMAPTIVPDSATASSWDVLSGLGAKTAPATALTYDSAVHGVNAASSATLDARYTSAIDALLSDKDPTRDINIVVAARKSDTIATKLKSHVKVASGRGLSRRAIWSPKLTMLSVDTAVSTGSGGVGYARDERVDYAWPGVRHFVPEAVGSTIDCSDATTTTDGYLDDSADVWLASVEANLPPENNPGQASEPVPTIMAPITAFARGTPDLTIAEYTTFRSYGIVGVRFDRIAGPIFQSGITSSLTSGEKNISRRRMADYTQDSIAARLNLLSKNVARQALKDTASSEVVAFLEGLLSKNNPVAQRIDGYLVDDSSGNTADDSADGIHTIIVKVRLLGSIDSFVLQTEIGESVNVTAT
jgi:hypothetical protein